jgi:hypothetical protein
LINHCSTTKELEVHKIDRYHDLGRTIRLLVAERRQLRDEIRSGTVPLRGERYEAVIRQHIEVREIAREPVAPFLSELERQQQYQNAPRPHHSQKWDVV